MRGGDVTRTVPYHISHWLDVSISFEMCSNIAIDIPDNLHTDILVDPLCEYAPSSHVAYKKHMEYVAMAKMSGRHYQGTSISRDIM